MLLLAVLTSSLPGALGGAEPSPLDLRIEVAERQSGTVDSVPKTSDGARNRARTFTFSGAAQPLEFEVYDERTKTVKRGLGYPTLSPGKLTFSHSGDRDQWVDPTKPLHYGKGDLIATNVDRDLDAVLAAERGRLIALRSEYESMLQVKAANPEAMSDLALALKEGEVVRLETAILEKEMNRDLMQAVIAPADAEIIEGTRQSVNINPSSGDLFRYYPLSHVRFQLRLPLAAWGPDWAMELDVNGGPAQILKIYSVDLDETNEQWILGIEIRPARPLHRMSETFQYRLVTTVPRIERLSEGLKLHRPSCALVGRRLIFPLTAPKISGLLYFSKRENSWVREGDLVGGVKLRGMTELLAKVTDFRGRVEKLIAEVETRFIPLGAVARNDSDLVSIRQHHAEAGRFVERASAMTIEAKASGLLVGTLDYQGPLTSGSGDLRARIETPFVEIPDVLVSKDVDIRDEDVVFVTLPSGTEKLAKVYKIVPETVGPIQDLRDVKLVSVMVYSNEFQVGERSSRRLGASGLAGRESGMPVYVSVPSYASQAERARVQSSLRAEFERKKTAPPPTKALYPIQFTFRHSSLTPLEKMAYMRRATVSAEQTRDISSTYPDRLTAAIIKEQDPELRWVAFQRLIALRFISGYEPLVRIALQGSPDVASASLFHLQEKQREFELFDILCRLRAESSDWNGATVRQRGPTLSLAYQLLRGLIDYPHPQSDSLTHLVKRGRLDSAFQDRCLDFFFSVIRTEGANAPASLRILRGVDQAGQPFLPEYGLEAAVIRAEEGHDSYLSAVFQRELERRDLMGISLNSKYGYGATFIEKGFLYLRDLDQIDSLARSRENYTNDLRFLASSPHWTISFPLDPAVLAGLSTRQEAPDLDSAGQTNSRWASGFASFGHDVDFAAFHQLTIAERSRLIQDLGSKRDYSTLVLLLRDRFIRRHHAGDILDWLLLTPESRLELARYYAQSSDTGLLDLVDDRRFDVEVLADIDSTIRRLEGGAYAAGKAAGRSLEQVVDPASIHIYQQLLLRFWQRASSESDRFHLLVSWTGLLPSGFELGKELTSYRPLAGHGVSRNAFESAIRYVRQRRALKHAVERERQKRAENRAVEIRPGSEEKILREIVQEVEAGMPPRSYPLALLRREVERASNDVKSAEEMSILQDALRLSYIRERQFATGQREHLRFQDIALYAIRIVLAPLYLLAFVLLLWIVSVVHLIFQTLFFGAKISEKYFQTNMRRAHKLLAAIEDSNPVKRDLSRWIRILDADKLNIDGLVRLQESVRRIFNARNLVYHVSPSSAGPDAATRNQPRVAREDSLHPDVCGRLAPCLTLLALLARLTGERIWYEARRDDTNGRRKYLLMEWFFQRSAYFSGYRYALDPLANYHIAENYIWHDIPYVEYRAEWTVFWILIFPLNMLIGIANTFGRICLSFPMRFLYLFTPVSLLGAAIFKFSLRRLVLNAGNRLEEHLYPNPDALMARTSERLRTGWGHRRPTPDQPGGRYLFSHRRVATRVLPFVILTTVISGGFPYLYEVLTGHSWGAAWNIRSTGIYAAFAALFVLAITLVLHWLPLMMGWIPFAHLRNVNRIRLLRRRARRRLVAKGERKSHGKVDADQELQALYFRDALAAMAAEKAAASPILDLLVLMVEDPALLDRYRQLAANLVSHKTTVLAYHTSEFMDGGGARLATLKAIDESYGEICKLHPGLPDRFEDTRSCFMPIGRDCDPLIELPVRIGDSDASCDGGGNLLTPFVLALANVQALMRHSFVYQEKGEAKRFVGSITASPQRLYIGSHNVDQGGRFRGGITLLGAFESIQMAGHQRALVIIGNRAFIRNSPEQLHMILQKNQALHQWADPDNFKKRQLPVAQLVIERFRTPERYCRHVHTSIRYIDQIQEIKEELLAKGRLDEADVTDEQFLNKIAIHYMRHLIAPWFIAHQGGSLENYRSGVLTGHLGVRDRRRIFHNRVLELIELFQQEGQVTRRQLPKVRFVVAPTGRIFYAKRRQDAVSLWRDPSQLIPGSLAARVGSREGRATFSDQDGNGQDHERADRRHVLGHPPQRDHTEVIDTHG